MGNVQMGKRWLTFSNYDRCDDDDAAGEGKEEEEEEEEEGGEAILY